MVSLVSSTDQQKSIQQIYTTHTARPVSHHMLMKSAMTSKTRPAIEVHMAHDNNAGFRLLVPKEVKQGVYNLLLDGKQTSLGAEATTLLTKQETFNRNLAAILSGKGSISPANENHLGPLLDILPVYASFINENFTRPEEKEIAMHLVSHLLPTLHLMGFHDMRHPLDVAQVMMANSSTVPNARIANFIVGLFHDVKNSLYNPKGRDLPLHPEVSARIAEIILPDIFGSLSRNGVAQNLMQHIPVISRILKINSDSMYVLKNAIDKLLKSLNAEEWYAMFLRRGEAANSKQLEIIKPGDVKALKDIAIPIESLPKFQTALFPEITAKLEAGQPLDDPELATIQSLPIEYIETTLFSLTTHHLDEALSKVWPDLPSNLAVADQLLLTARKCARYPNAPWESEGLYKNIASWVGSYWDNITRIDKEGALTQQRAEFALDVYLSTFNSLQKFGMILSDISLDMASIQAARKGLNTQSLNDQKTIKASITQAKEAIEEIKAKLLDKDNWSRKSVSSPQEFKNLQQAMKAMYPALPS